ncbi:MAG: E3 binding domain-containing protein [Rubrobacteraceae bacterium]
MSGENGAPGSNLDPLDAWRQWYEASIGSWSSLHSDDRGGYANPYELYLGWLGSLQELGRDSGSATGAADDQEDYWQRLMEATTESWRRAAGLTPLFAGAAPRWAEAIGEFWQQMLGPGGPPVDPLEFYQRWYSAVSAPLSEVASETLENESFLQYSRQFFRYYATFDRMFRRLSQEYFSWLQVATGPDAARIASLVVTVDERVDQLEEALEDSDFGREGVARAEDAAELKKRLERVEERLGQLDRVEGKLDQLLRALEPPAYEPEPNATDAAREEAGRLGVELSEVQGTGAGGRITVGDVREKGES